MQVMPIHEQNFREGYDAEEMSIAEPELQFRQQYINEQSGSVATFLRPPTATTVITGNITVTATTAITATIVTPAPYLDVGDVEMVYSDASSIAALPKKRYIAELADALFDGVPAEQPDSRALERVSMVLPELLKAFALKLGYSAPTQMHRDVMVFVHKNRGEVAENFMEMCSRDEVDNLFDTGTANANNMTVDEKMSLWHERSVYTHPYDQSPFVEERPGEEILQEEAEIEEYDAEIFQQLPYRDFIFNAPAFEWLVESLRREFLLASMEPNCMEAIKNEIIKALPSSHRVSKLRSAEAFKVIFTTGWQPLEFVSEEGYQNEVGEAIEGAITLTGSSRDAQALTCAQYMCQTWSPTGNNIIGLIKDIVRDESRNIYICTPPTTALASLR
ncbi:hypothetical protein ABW20_dc0105558 [Dactylellina cionopaga]|nr:hypothetical protein ABW20_dc0105558 [Dactylellina cionopaga]